MEFLKEVLGEEVYTQLAAMINSHNGKEENKDKQVKLGNIASGEYVSKVELDRVQETLKGRETELATANGLIADLKKGTKGDEELQGKITTYETQIANLQKENAEIKMNSAIKVALLSEKAVDVDYLTYKLNEKMKEKGETLELDENDKIKGWEEKLSGLKTQFPTMFKTQGNDGYRVLGDNRLPTRDNGRAEPKDLAEALKQKYENPTE